MGDDSGDGASVGTSCAGSLSRGRGEGATSDIVTKYCRVSEQTGLLITLRRKYSSEMKLVPKVDHDDEIDALDHGEKDARGVRW